MGDFRDFFHCNNGMVEPPEPPGFARSPNMNLFLLWGVWKMVWEEAEPRLESAIHGLFADPAVEAGTSVAVPDALGADAAAVLLLLVLDLVPRFPVAGGRGRPTKRGEKGKRDDNEARKRSPAAAALLGKA